MFFSLLGLGSNKIGIKNNKECFVSLLKWLHFQLLNNYSDKTSCWNCKILSVCNDFGNLLSPVQIYFQYQWKLTGILFRLKKYLISWVDC